MRKEVKESSVELLQLLISYSWRGNISELRNASEYCVMMNVGDDAVMLKHLPGEMRMALLYPEAEDNSGMDPLAQERKSLKESEADLIKKAVDMANGDVGVAAKQLGMSRATLYRRIKKLKEQGSYL